MVTDPNNPNNQAPGQPNPIGMGQTPPANPANPAQPKGSGRFTNLQKYVTANQGAGQQIGQRIGSQVTNQSNQVREGIAQAKTGFQSQVDKDQERIGQAGSLVTQAVTDPNAIAADQAKLSQFQQVRDAQTANINQLTLEQQQNQANQANQMAQNTNTEQGRFQLLKGAFANPRYTTGLGRLDQLFLQSSPALGNLQQQSKAVTQGLGGEIQGAQQYSQQQLAARDQAAKAAQSNLMSSIGSEDDPSTPDVDESQGAFGGLSKDMFGRIKTEQGKLDTTYNDILSRFDAVPNAGPAGVEGKMQGADQLGTHKAKSVQEVFQNLTAEQQGMLGLNKDMVLGNMSPDEFKSYLRKRDLGNNERARFFNQGEYDKYNAYAGLMGKNTAQTLSQDEKQLLGKGLGETSLIAGPQFQQQIKANEAGLWSGGYLNDMNDLMNGYDRAQAGGEIKNEVQLNPINDFLQSQGVGSGNGLGAAFTADDAAIRKAITNSFIGKNGLNTEMAIQQNPAAQAQIDNILSQAKGVRDKATVDWRSGQLIDRAKNAGMSQTLGGRDLSAKELYQRYQDFKSKGII